VRWIGRTGAPWRDLPPELGNWHTTFTRFLRWAKKGVWERRFQVLSQDRDLEEVLFDSTVVRVHQPPPGLKKYGPQALGRSRGGFSTKTHVLVDALGNPISFTFTGGEHADITQALALLGKVSGWAAVIADKGYDADALVNLSNPKAPSPLSRCARIATRHATMIDTSTRRTTSWNASSLSSNNSDASLHVMRNSPLISLPWSPVAVSCCG
jgi:transposase